MKYVLLGLSLIAAIAASGCGSSAVETTTANSVTQANQSVPPANTTSNVNSVSNAVVVTPQQLSNVNVNAPVGKTIDLSKQPVKPLTFPAADNSQYSTVMGSDGLPLETRQFNNNPQLVKVVKSWKSPTDKSIEVYLKGGKVVKLDGNAIENLREASAAAILTAAGVNGPPASKPDQTAKKEKQ